MKSLRNRRSTRRNRKNRNRNRTRRGGAGEGRSWSLFSSKPAAPKPAPKPKTYDENVAICKLDVKNTNCKFTALRNDYTQDKNKYGPYIRENPARLFPRVFKPKKFEEYISVKGRPTQYYYYPDGSESATQNAGFELPESEKDKIRRYNEIGRPVLPKYDKETREIIVGYGKTDTPLTDEDVHDRTYEELEEYIDSLPDLTEEDVNNKYVERVIKI